MGSLLPITDLGNLGMPHQLRQHRRHKFPYGLADAADSSGKKGSNVYEVTSRWPMAVAVWSGQTSSGGLWVAATEERHIDVVKPAATKAVATLVWRSLKAPKAAGPIKNGMKIPQGYPWYKYLRLRYPWYMTFRNICLKIQKLEYRTRIYHAQTFYFWIFMSYPKYMHAWRFQKRYTCHIPGIC